MLIKERLKRSRNLEHYTFFAIKEKIKVKRTTGKKK
jgi:hypothetical protein